MQKFIKKYLEKIALPFFVIGIFLFLVNITGLLIPLKNPNIYKEKNVGFINDITLSTKEAFDELNKLSPAPTIEYVSQINTIINKSIAHYWENSGIEKYNLTIPFYKNYILYTLSFIRPDVYKKYEFCNYEDAIKRGVGLCSQHAIALTDFLNKQGIKTSIVELSGHVVTQVYLPNKTIIADPDFGVLLPYPLKEIEQKPEIIIPFYKNKLPIKNISTDDLVKIYAKEGNKINSIGVSSYIDCNPKKILIKRMSSFLVWLFPFILTLPFVIAKLKFKH